MDKEIRNRIQRATQAARTLLEQEYEKQLEGVFDIRMDGTIAAEPGSHLVDAAQPIARAKMVAAIEHLRSSGLKPAEAVESYRREAAFTTLNRFVALKMLEARELVQECVSRGDQSSGFKEFAGLAPGLAQLPDHGYKIYIESIFDEIGTEVRVLFDRRDPASLLWPRRQTFIDLLDILNDVELAEIWKEDETIGWVYQYFNDENERKNARYDDKGKPKPPQNSHELAVRNQFFTPRYVVEFLTNNTLGRIWHEMRHGKTQLGDDSTYLVRLPKEVFLARDEIAPVDSEMKDGCKQEEQLKKAVYVPFRAKKDPRDIKILDPACGSGHFLLCAFDLLVRIYEEGWKDISAPTSEVTANRLRDEYKSQEELRRALPGLVLRYNLYGIEIDHRAAQIAVLALWMRAQRAYNEFGINRSDRAAIAKTNIVVAEPLPGEKELKREFVSSLSAQLGKLADRVFDKMELAGEAGSLLSIEDDIRVAIREIYGEGGDLFLKSDESRWRSAEEQLIEALHCYAENTQNERAYQRRLFAEDTVRGLGFIDLCRQQYDVVLMNPPFGECPSSVSPILKAKSSVEDLFCGFVHRALELSPCGMVGAITNASFLLYTDYSDYRTFLRDQCNIPLLVDLGWGVLDAAVRTCMYSLSLDQGKQNSTLFLDLASKNEHDKILLEGIDHLRNGHLKDHWYIQKVSSFSAIEGSPFCFWFKPTFFSWIKSARKLSNYWEDHGIGAGPHNFFFRLRWELPREEQSGQKKWPILANGGHYSPFFRDNHLHIDWGRNGRKIKAHLEHVYPYLNGNVGIKIQREHIYGKPGITYGKRTGRFNAQMLLSGAIPSFEGIGAYPQKETDTWWLLAYMNSRFVAFFLNMTCGQHKNSVYLDRVPVPDFSDEQKEQLEHAAKTLFSAQQDACSIREISSEFELPALMQVQGKRLVDRMRSWRQRDRERELGMWKAIARIEDTVWDAIGVSDTILKSADIDQGPDIARQSGMTISLSFPSISVSGPSRPAIARGERRETDLFRLAVESGASPSVAADHLNQLGFFEPDEFILRITELLSWLFGVCNERFATDAYIPFKESKSISRGIWVNDEGHELDISPAVESHLLSLWGIGAESIVQEIVETLNVKSLRSWFKLQFFPYHVSYYSVLRRKAPIYWQLGTPSASYSVWLFYQCLSGDTLYRILNDLVTLKLNHEELRLAERLRNFGVRITDTLRREIAEQESFVEELRVFRDEIARIAPLWNPDLNDGVIINFAPLWRLVPQNKAWQKECKECWDKLVAGDYDWAHLAMHLWPERVVPKCVNDRSLAIAHRLEDVFWIEGSNGKWQKRDVDAETVQKLIDERTSPAVKAALKSLLEAPTPGNARRRTKAAGKRQKTREVQ